jgi:hypothetical protein
MQGNARNLLEDLKGKHPEGVQAFATIRDWFSRFEIHPGFYSVEVYRKALREVADRQGEFDE